MNITVVIVAYKSEQLIYKNLINYPSDINIIIIENSMNIKMKHEVETKYKNIKVILNQNNGFGHAANLGANLTNTKYIFFCSPDNFIEKNFLNELNNIKKELNDNFDMLILSNKDSSILENKKIKNIEGISCFIIKKKTFFDLSGFDENFFLYYEDTDFLKRFLKKKYIAYKVPVYYFSYGGSHEEKFNFPVEVNRNWHYMWSKFYYEKKHNGYIYSFLKTLPYFIRSIIKVLIHYRNYKKREIYYARASGLFNSFLLKKSWYRPKID